MSASKLHWTVTTNELKKTFIIPSAVNVTLWGWQVLFTLELPANFCTPCCCATTAAQLSCMTMHPHALVIMCAVNMSYRHSSLEGLRPANQSKLSHVDHYSRTQTRMDSYLLPAQVCACRLITHLVQCGTTSMYFWIIHIKPYSLKGKKR